MGRLQGRPVRVDGMAEMLAEREEDLVVVCPGLPQVAVAMVEQEAVLLQVAVSLTVMELFPT